MLELFVRSRKTIVHRDAETLGHAEIGAGAQMHAAAAAGSVLVLPKAESEALDRMQSLAEALHEDFVVWDLATLRGRREARRRHIRETPRVVFRSGGPESVQAFQARAAALLRKKTVMAS